MALHPHVCTVLTFYVFMMTPRVAKGNGTEMLLAHYGATLHPTDEAGRAKLYAAIEESYQLVIDARFEQVARTIAANEGEA